MDSGFTSTMQVPHTPPPEQLRSSLSCSSTEQQRELISSRRRGTASKRQSGIAAGGSRTYVGPVEVDVALEHDVPELLPAARRPVVHVRRPVRQQPRLQQPATIDVS